MATVALGGDLSDFFQVVGLSGQNVNKTNLAYPLVASTTQPHLLQGPTLLVSGTAGVTCHGINAPF
jgi:hypothetical protein